MMTTTEKASFLRDTLEALTEAPIMGMGYALACEWLEARIVWLESGGDELEPNGEV